MTAAAARAGGDGYETIRYAVREGVATLALARPEQLNALDAQMKADLIHALRRAPREARAVLITGLGDAFCAGQDLGDAPNIAEADLGRTMREETRPLLEALAACEVPVVAGVNGSAAGAGLALALAADIAVAAESASLAVLSPRLGMIPDSGLSWWLPRLIGSARASGLAMLGEPISARRAADWGLIWECVPDEDFAATVETRAGALASGPGAALRLTREALMSGLDSTWSDQLETEARLQAQAGATRDFLEGALAWTEGRAPRFEGR